MLRITSTSFRFIKIRYCICFANNTYLRKDFDVGLDFRVEFTSNGLFEIDVSALRSFYAMQVSWKLYTDLLIVQELRTSMIFIESIAHRSIPPG